MGFFAMLGSFFLGIFLIVFGFTRKGSQNNGWLKGSSILIGIGLVSFAVWLGLPK